MTCPFCGDDLYPYEQFTCLTHGRICEVCVEACTECETKHCPACMVVDDGQKFCDGGCIEKYKQRSFKVTYREPTASKRSGKMDSM